MAETIRIEVVDTSTSTASSSNSSGDQQPNRGSDPYPGSAGGGGGSQTDQWVSKSLAERLAEFRKSNPELTKTSDILNGFRELTREQRDHAQRRGRSSRERNHQYYLNQEQHGLSLALGSFQWQRQQQNPLTDLLKLPDRMTTGLQGALSRAQKENDTGAAQRIAHALQQYDQARGQRSIGAWTNLFGSGATSLMQRGGPLGNYHQLAHGIQNVGSSIASSFGGLATKATLVTAALGVMVGVVGAANDKLREEKERVRGFSPTIQMQEMRNQLRNMRTDVQIARDFGGQMARQSDRESRNENAWRVIGSRISSAISKPFEGIQELYTQTLEFFAGTRKTENSQLKHIAEMMGPLKQAAEKQLGKLEHVEIQENELPAEIKMAKQLANEILGQLVPGERMNLKKRDPNDVVGLQVKIPPAFN